MDARLRLALTWFGLSFITLVSWWISTRYDRDTFQPNAIVFLSVLAIAAIKARVIFRQFMGVRHAPARLKYLSDAWIALTIAALVADYFI
jgi:hypothetical protein